MRASKHSKSDHFDQDNNETDPILFILNFETYYEMEFILLSYLHFITRDQ